MGNPNPLTSTIIQFMLSCPKSLMHRHNSKKKLSYLGKASKEHFANHLLALPQKKAKESPLESEQGAPNFTRPLWGIWPPASHLMPLARRTRRVLCRTSCCSCGSGPLAPALRVCVLRGRGEGGM